MLAAVVGFAARVGLGDVGEEVEGLAEGLLGVTVEAQRVHAGRCIARRRECEDVAVREIIREMLRGCAQGAVPVSDGGN